MLTNYARWYSFTPPQWPTLSPPLTIDLDERLIVDKLVNFDYFRKHTEVDPVVWTESGKN